MRTLALMLIVSGTCAYAQQPVQQVVEGFAPARADRLYKALSVEGKVLNEFRERTGDSYDDVLVGLRWNVTSQHKKDGRGWMIRGRLGVVFMSNPDAGTACWMRDEYGGDVDANPSPCMYGYPYNGPPTARQKFIYDKPVMITYQAEGGVLTIAMLDSEEEAGTFNLAATSVADEAHDFNVGLSVRQLSLGVTASNKQYTVVATGLPYVARPVLEVKTLPGDYVAVCFGLLWESRMTINAPTFGIQSDSNGSSDVEFSWGNQPSLELKATGKTTRSDFDSSIMIKTEGEGLRAVVRYDESLAHRAYEMVARADQKWVMQVHNIAFLRAGSLQEERSVEIGQRWEGKFWNRQEAEWLDTWSPFDAPSMPSTARELPRELPRTIGEEPNNEAAAFAPPAALEPFVPETAMESAAAPLLPGIQINRPEGLVDDQQRWDRVQEMYRGAQPPTAGVSGALQQH